MRRAQSQPTWSSPRKWRPGGLQLRAARAHHPSWMQKPNLLMLDLYRLYIQAMASNLIAMLDLYLYMSGDPGE